MGVLSDGTTYLTLLFLSRMGGVDVPNSAHDRRLGQDTPVKGPATENTELSAPKRG